MVQKLLRKSLFLPAELDIDDEYYNRGIFQWNISRLWQYIDDNRADFIVEVVLTDDYSSWLSINESHVDSVDINRPVLLAEVSPGDYSLIDGQHRITKALRNGLSSVPAFKINANIHVDFMTSEKSYLQYLEYWNEKVAAANKRLLKVVKL